MKFKPTYIIHLIIPIVLIYLMVHIKSGTNATCCCCGNTNSSFSLGKDATYVDTFLSVQYSPIIVPTLYITKPLIKIYSEEINAEIYEEGDIVAYAGFCLDNQKEDIAISKNKPVNNYDPYNFSYLYFAICLNIIISYFMWLYLINLLREHKKTKYILLSIFVLLLPYLFLMNWMSIESIDSVPYPKYFEKYQKDKENNFLIKWDD